MGGACASSKQQLAPPGPRRGPEWLHKRIPWMRLGTANGHRSAACSALERVLHVPEEWKVCVYLVRTDSQGTEPTGYAGHVGPKGAPFRFPPFQTFPAVATDAPSGKAHGWLEPLPGVHTPTGERVRAVKGGMGYPKRPLPGTYALANPLVKGLVRPLPSVRLQLVPLTRSWGGEPGGQSAHAALRGPYDGAARRS